MIYFASEEESNAFSDPGKFFSISNFNTEINIHLLLLRPPNIFCTPFNQFSLNLINYALFSPLLKGNQKFEEIFLNRKGHSLTSPYE